MTARPPTLDRPAEADGPEPPEVLFREARRRRRWRWAIGVVVVVVAAASAIVGLEVAGNGGNTQGQTSPQSPRHATTGAPGNPVPAASGALLSAAPRLQTVSFFNPTDGYGLFERGTGANCVADVAPTNDGGARFAPLVRLPGCGASAVAFDDHTDGFAYGPDLYVSHDAGTKWSARSQPGRVLSIEALGSSVWMLEAICPQPANASTPAQGVETCRPRVVESTDGGRTWAQSPAQPGPGAFLLPAHVSSSEPASLVRTSTTSAYVVGTPAKPTPLDQPVTTAATVPLWSTTDGGRAWATESIPCGLPGSPSPVSARVSAAPDGTLFAVCGYFTQVGGSQDKAVFVSSDHGASWSLRGSCLRVPSATCASGTLGNGDLGTLDAVSATTVFELGPRGFVLESTDGGTTWRAWVSPGPTLIATGPASLALFDPAHGIVLALTKIWHTSDGGGAWTPTVPVASRTTAAATTPCAASQLAVSFGPTRTATGHVLDVVRLTNTGATCTLSGLPLLSGTSTNGQRRMLKGGGGSVFGTLLPARLAHGQVGQLWLTTHSSTTCTGSTHGRIDALEAALPGAGGTLSLGTFSFTLACGIGWSRLGVPTAGTRGPTSP